MKAIKFQALIYKYTFCRYVVSCDLFAAVQRIDFFYCIIFVCLSLLMVNKVDHTSISVKHQLVTQTRIHSRQTRVSADYLFTTLQTIC